MTQTERDLLGQAIAQIGFLYGQELPRERITMFITSLESFIPADPMEYHEALQKYSKDPKNRAFPNPIQLRPYLRPELSVDTKANEAASRIREAVGKFGWANPNEARLYMGELAWRIVERFGGWPYICQNLGVDLQTAIFHAHARDLAKAMLETIDVGQFDQPIGLPSPKKETDLVKGDFTKLIGVKKETT